MAAKPGTDYNFDKLDFEVREFTSIELESMFSLTNLFWILSLLCLLGAIIAAGILIYQAVKSRQAGAGANQAGANGSVEMQDKSAN